MTHKTNPREGKNWPGYVLGGRLRTSTLVLIIAFLGIGWLYETYEPTPDAPEQVPATEVVPPGFIPDPNYTWAPRTDVQRRSEPTTTTSSTPTSSTPTPPSTPTPAPATPAPTETGGAPQPPSPAPSSAPGTQAPASPSSVAAPTPEASAPPVSTPPTEAAQAAPAPAPAR